MTNTEVLKLFNETYPEVDDNYQEGILTPEERSEVLNAIDDALHGYQVDGYEDTDGMFFKVLIRKAESCSEKPNRSDTIYRQDAMSIADDIRDCISVEGYWAWIERLKALPSAQQER